MKILPDNSQVEARYASILKASPSATVYQTADWLRVFKTLGYEVVYVEAADDALIPFVCKGRGRLRRAWSLPYDTYGGPVTAERQHVEYDEVLRTLKIPSARIVDFSDNVVAGASEVQQVKTRLVELDTSYESVFASYSKMNQRAIRQAFKRGLRITEVKEAWNIPLFYKLYKKTLLRYRTPPLPQRFFDSIFEFMVPKGLARFYLGWHEDKAIAGNLVLRYKDQAYDWSWGYDRDYLHLRPTNALVDRAIQDEVADGTKVFNLGTSPANSNGNALFKENFGARDYTYQILSQTGFAYQTARAVKKGLRFRGRLK